MSLLHPAQRIIHELKDEADVGQRLDRLFLAFDLILRVDALVHASLFLQSDCRDDKVRSLLLKTKLNLGDWHALLQALSARKDNYPGDDSLDWFRQMEQRCRERRFQNCRESAVQSLLWLRNRRAHALSRMEPVFIRDCLETAECCLDYLLRLHPELASFDTEEDGKLHALTGNKRCCCWPFLLPGALAGREHDLLIYSGNSGRAFEYDSMSGGVYANSEVQQSVLTLFKHRYAPLEYVPSTVSPYVLQERLLQSTWKTVGQKSQAGQYRSESYVPRAEADAVFNAFVRSDAPVLVVEGPAGAGKTSWLCARAEGRIAAKCLVLMVPFERLPDRVLPDALCDYVRVQGELGTALERLAATSADGRVVILMDDIGAFGRAQEALNRVFRWAEQLSPDSPIRLVLAIRREQLRLARQQDETAWESGLASTYGLPPLNCRELIAMAENLPVHTALDPEVLLEQRRALAIRLSSFKDSYVRRPGLAVTILGLVSKPEGTSVSKNPRIVPDPNQILSTDEVYAEIIRRDVLAMGSGGIPSTPLRFSVLKEIARVMLAQSTSCLPLESLNGVRDRLIEPTTGRRTPDYEALLSDQILVEVLEDFNSNITFASPMFFAYVGALSVKRKGDLDGLLSGLQQQSKHFAPALTVAAFVVIRAVQDAGTESVCQALIRLGGWRYRLLRQIAPLEPRTFLTLLETIAAYAPADTSDILQWLVETGEHRLASLAAQVVIHSSTDPAVLSEARFQLARAHYEMDEYAQAVAELKNIPHYKSFQAQILLGDLASSQGLWLDAQACYDLALQQATGPIQQAQALRGVGYVWGKAGDLDRARTALEKAIEIFKRAPGSRMEAEAWSDLGEVLREKRLLVEARKCLEQSLAINRKNGCLPGIGIVEGILGDLDLAAGHLDDATRRLNSALDIARLTENRYRQAYAMARLGQLNQQTGHHEAAKVMLDESRNIYAQIGGKEK
jgi:tetratricopeptide (TPR) repeat protein